MLIQDIVPPQQVVLLREIFLEVPVRSKPTLTPSKPSKAHKTKVKVH